MARLLITHVTRMQPGFCCVAGIAPMSHAHVRPTNGQRLPTRLLAPLGGPFDMGAIVELGETIYEGSPPEVEDHRFDSRDCRRLGYVSGDRLWTLLKETSSARLSDIFGPDLVAEPARGRATVQVGHGIASLGCWRPDEPLILAVQETANGSTVRIRLPRSNLDLSLTDARYYTDGYSHADPERVGAAQRALAMRHEVLLGVGLTRAFSPRTGEPERHWLQVNALHIRPLAGLRLR